MQTKLYANERAGGINKLSSFFAYFSGRRVYFQSSFFFCCVVTSSSRPFEYIMWEKIQLEWDKCTVHCTGTPSFLFVLVWKYVVEGATGEYAGYKSHDVE